jgi:RHS repeat-associated protein
VCLACLYNGGVLVAELDANGQVRAEYVWGPLGPVARIAGGRVQLYVCDALGHVRALIDAETCQITDRYDYDAWGNVVHNGTTRQPFTWNGAYGYEWMPFTWDRAPGYDDTWHLEIGLYHVGTRAYDPRTARWLQRDPINTSSYRYAENNPLNQIDPDGTNWSYHDLLGAAGFIPVVGETANLANPLAYALEEDWGNLA